MRRSNCIVWGLSMLLRNGGMLLVRRSPEYPMLPRVSWSIDGRVWWRFMHIGRGNKPTGFKKWLPLHALWFTGDAKRDIVGVTL
jgi:hypothetical protein